MTDFTPTTESVREAYTYGRTTCGCCVYDDPAAMADFDRWLNEVRAEAIRSVARLTKHQEHPFVSVGDILEYAQRVRNGEA